MEKIREMTIVVEGVEKERCGEVRWMSGKVGGEKEVRFLWNRMYEGFVVMMERCEEGEEINSKPGMSVVWMGKEGKRHETRVWKREDVAVVRMMCDLGQVECLRVWRWWCGSKMGMSLKGNGEVYVELDMSGGMVWWPRLMELEEGLWGCVEEGDRYEDDGGLLKSLGEMMDDDTMDGDREM
jgi:hypothetical protein